MVLQILTASQATYYRDLSPVKLFFRVFFFFKQSEKLKPYYHCFPALKKSFESQKTKQNKTQPTDQQQQKKAAETRNGNR